MRLVRRPGAPAGRGAASLGDDVEIGLGVRENSAQNAATTLGSNCEPAPRSSCASASAGSSAAWCGRSEVMSSNALQTNTIRDPERDHLTGEAVGVSGAVPALVAVAHEPGDGLHPERTGQEPLADERVQQDELPLGPVDLARVSEHGARHRDVADVAQVHRLLDRLDLGLGDPEPAGDPGGERGHVDARSNQPQRLDRVDRRPRPDFT